MSADLYIHVFEPPLERRHLRVFFSDEDEKAREAAHEAIANSPQVWVGEVSWLTAMTLEDDETCVPDAVRVVSDAIGEDPPVVIDDALIAKCCEALAKPRTNARRYRTADPKDVRDFLEKYKGKRCFTVSW